MQVSQIFIRKISYMANVYHNTKSMCHLDHGKGCRCWTKTIVNVMSKMAYMYMPFYNRVVNLRL